MKINIHQLKTGLHDLEYSETAKELGIKAAECFPNSIISRLTIDKNEIHIYIYGKISSMAHFACDRCLEEFDQQISGDLKLYYEVIAPGGHSRFSDEDERAEDSVRIFRSDTQELDIGADVAETMLLEIPMKTLCSPECKGLCAGCGENLNSGSCKCAGKPVDPRWDGLKQFLQK